MVEMWCYQKPDFEAQLITELQRQQQQRQFCDTLLKTKDVSLPAHSCILAAISPQICSALSSSPAPQAGQSHLLEFRTLGGCTLLHLARLFYSGEMAGEGESERQEAISAAAKLGIRGLVEVPRTPVDSRQVEVGVQTEEQEGGAGWGREVGASCPLPLGDAASGSERDTWARTEEPQASVAPPPQPSTPLETIDMTSIQTMHSGLLSEQIPYVPLSGLYAPEELQTYQLSSAPVHSLQESRASGHRSASVLMPPPFPPLTPPPSQAAQQDVSPVEWWDDSNLGEFQGNIPGFIKRFLNPPSQERPRRGRPRGRRCAAGGGAKRGRVSGSGTSNPRGGRRGRVRLTQTVDVQDVGVSKGQKLFLQRCSTRLSRTGQGGGAIGRILSLKPREVLKSAKRGQSRGAQFKMWTFCPSRDGPPYKEEVSGGASCSRKRTTKPTNQDKLPFIQPHKTRPRSAASLPFLTPPAHSHNALPTSSSSLSLPPLPSPVLVSSASSTLSGTPAPAALPLPSHIDHLLNEVMMGLNIMPTNNTSSQTLAANVLGGGAGCGSASSETLVVQQQQQGEGELNDILDRFLLSFEQHINSSAAWEEESAQSSADVAEQTTQMQQQQDVAEPPVNNLKPRETQRATQATRRRRKRTRRTSWLKSDKARVGKPPPPPYGVNSTRVFPDLQDKQLQQVAVVKLERRGFLPSQANLQDPSSLSARNPAVSHIISSTLKQGMNGSCRKKQKAWLPTKTYPIRSKIREACLDTELCLERPLQPRRNRLSQPKRCTKKESAIWEEQHEETEMELDTGSKRTAEEVELLGDARAVKRVRPAGKQQTGSPVPDDEIIDVETVSVSAEDAIPGQVASDFGLGEREAREKEKEEETTSSTDEVISVGGGDCGQTRGDRDSTAGGPEEIDVIGGSSPCPAPVTITWTEPSEEEKEEVDVVIIEESETKYSSSTVIDILD